MNTNKIASVLKKNKIAKGVRANNGYSLKDFGSFIQVGYYSHFTAQQVAGMKKIAEAFKAEGIKFEKDGCVLVIVK